MQSCRRVQTKLMIMASPAFSVSIKRRRYFLLYLASIFHTSGSLIPALSRSSRSSLSLVYRAREGLSVYPEKSIPKIQCSRNGKGTNFNPRLTVHVHLFNAQTERAAAREKRRQKERKKTSFKTYSRSTPVPHSKPPFSSFGGHKIEA